MSDTTPALPLHLGCPVWNSPRWEGEVFPARTPRTKWLSWYTRTFNTVEGNSTFYALPSLDSARRWASESAEGFRFCFKFPQEISHHLQLEGASESTQTFLKVLEPLAENRRLGPTFLQLGPSFGPDRLETLRTYLKTLPRDFSWAVELRHHGWFDSSEHEKRVNELLRELNIDKVLFDSRPLYQAPPDDAIEEKSQGRKPRTPVRQTLTGNRPMLRIVGRNRIEMTDRFFLQWAPIVAKWIRDGREAYVFTHAPDDGFAPVLARRFAAILETQLRESQDGEETKSDQEIKIPRPPRPQQQLSLLGEENG